MTSLPEIDDDQRLMFNCGLVKNGFAPYDSIVRIRGSIGSFRFDILLY